MVREFTAHLAQLLRPPLHLHQMLHSLCSMLIRRWQLVGCCASLGLWLWLWP